MSSKLLALASDLADSDPAGAQLVINIVKASTGNELIDALNSYDAALLGDEDVVEEDEEEAADLVAA